MNYQFDFFCVCVFSLRVEKMACSAVTFETPSKMALKKCLKNCWSQDLNHRLGLSMLPM